MTVAIVQARYGSSRLRGKALRTLGGRPMLAHVIERAQAVRDVDLVVLATTDNPNDEPLMQVALTLSCPVYVGAEWDVLKRVHDTAVCHSADVIVRVTGDCPFLAPDVCGDVLNAYRATQPDYMWNDTHRSGYPDGMDVEVFSREALALAAAQATDRADREHVTPWMRRMLRCGVVRCPDGDYSRLKLSVDTEADFAYAQSVHRHLRAGDFGMLATLAACDKVRSGGDDGPSAFA